MRNRPPLPDAAPLFRDIQIQTHTQCNFRCKFCPHGKIPIQHGEMTDETFQEVCRQLGELQFRGTIYPYLMNEPLMDPKLPARIAALRAACPGARIWVDTNGSLATAELLTRIVESGAGVVTMEMYLARGQRIARKYLDMHAELPAHVQERVFIYERAADAVLTNRAGNLPDRPVPARPLALPCERPFRQVYVAYDGSLLLCCQDWRREVIMGNLVETPLIEIWRSSEYERIRGSLLKPDRGMKLCERCDYSGRPSDMPACYRPQLPGGVRVRWRWAWPAAAARDVLGNRMLARYARGWLRRRVLGRIRRRA